MVVVKPHVPNYNLKGADMVDKWVHKNPNGTIDAVYDILEDCYIKNDKTAGTWPDNYDWHIPSQNLRMWSAADLKEWDLYEVTRDAPPTRDAETERLELSQVSIGGTESNETWTKRAATPDEIDSYARSRLASTDTDPVSVMAIEELVEIFASGRTPNAADVPQRSKDWLAERKRLRGLMR